MDRGAMNPEPHHRDVLDVLLFIGSLLIFFLCLLGAGVFILIAGFAGIAGNGAQASAGWGMAATLSLLGALALPASYHSFRALEGRRACAPRPSVGIPIAWIVAFALLLWIGSRIEGDAPFAAALRAGLHFLAAGAPVGAAVSLTLRGGPELSWKRVWGHVLSGIWISPLLALILEALTALPLLLLLFAQIWTGLNGPGVPETLRPGQALTQELLQAGAEEITRQPWILALGLSYVTLFIAIIEEATKSISIWPLLRRRPSPQAAFVGGALAGAGYGWFEALFLAQPGADWSAVMLARAGASMMHMVTAGITCMGVARAAQAGRAGPAVRAFLSAVALHALWNAAALGFGLGVWVDQTPEFLAGRPWGKTVEFASAAVLLGLTLAALIALARLPKAAPPEALEAPRLEGEARG